MGSNPKEPEDLVGHGEWWIPGQTKRLSGTVRFSEADGIHISFAGELAEQTVAQIPVLLGHTIGLGLVTLFDLYAASGSVTVAPNGERISRDEWWAQVMLVGAHVPSGERFEWKRAEFDMTHLPNWAAVRGEVAYGDDDRPSLSIDVPETLSAEISIGRLSLEWRERSRYSTSLTSVEVRPTFGLELDEPMTQTAIWHAGILPVMFLMDFLTDEANYLSSLRLIGSVEGAEVVCAVYGLSWSSRAPGERNHRYLYPIRREEVGGEFPQLVTRWFQLYEDAPSAFLQHFAHHYSSGSYLEELFSSSVRALESWHRETQRITKYPPAEFELMLNKIKSALDPREWQAVSGLMRFGNTPSLAQRLKGAIDASEPDISDLIDRYEGGRKAFVRLVVNSRNEHAHALDRPKTDDDYMSMSWAMETLRLVFIGIVIRGLALGDPVHARAALQRRSRWASLDSTLNPLMLRGGQE